MTSDNMICEIKNKPCSCYFSCQYVKDRFKVIECCPKHKEMANKVYQQELQDRRELLRRNEAHGR